MADKTLTCSDCGMEIAFTEREQAFYAEKGFAEPHRSPSCRTSPRPTASRHRNATRPPDRRAAPDRHATRHRNAKR